MNPAQTHEGDDPASPEEEVPNTLPADLVPLPEAGWSTHSGRTASFDPNGASLPLFRDAGVLPTIPGYEILAELGRGGMGVVYEARQVRLDRPCALKMILDHEHVGHEAALRFLAEAETVARLRHPNIIQVYHLGEHDGRPYMELEFAEGRSLDDQLDGMPWPPAKAAALVETICRAVAEAHRRNVVHRDLKPANVLITVDGTPKVSDFGLAKLLGTDSSLTRSGVVVGSPSYMAPEQAEGKSHAIGPAADIYALGVILYELLVGRPPFRGATVLETLELVRSAAPIAPSRLVPGLPLDVETIVMTCLHKDPSRRYGSVTLLADDLARFLQGKPIHARPVGPLERGWRWCRRNRMVASLLGATAGALLTALIVSILYAYGQTQDATRIRNLNTLLGNTLRQSNARLAALEFERAQVAFDQGRVGSGLLRLLESARTAKTANDPAWQHAAYAAIQAWQYHHSHLQALIDDPGHDIVEAVASHDGTTLAALSRRGLVLVCGPTGPTIDVRHPGHRIHGASFLPDGRLLTGGDDSFVRIWTIAPGVAHEDKHIAINEPIMAVAVDGESVAVATPSSVRVWNVVTGQPAGPAIQAAAGVAFARVRFSPDGETLLVGQAGDASRTQLFDRRNGQARGRALASALPVVLSRDGRLAATVPPESPSVVRLWNVRSGEPVGVPVQAGSNVRSVLFDRDGATLRVVSADGGIMRVSVPSGAIVAPPMQLSTAIDAVAESPDGTVLATSHSDGVVRFWSSDSGVPRGLSISQRRGVRSLAFTLDGQSLLTLGSDASARIWSIAQPDRAGLVAPPLVGAERVSAPIGEGSGLAFTPEGTALLTATGRAPGVVFQRWDARSGVERARRVDPNALAPSFALQPDGKAIAYSVSRGPLVFRDASSLAQVDAHIPIEDSDVAQFVFRPDGGAVALVDGGQVGRLLDARSGKTLATLGRLASPALLRFDPTGRWLAATTDDRNVQLWDAGTGRPLRSWRIGDAEPILDLRFQPGRHALALGGGDGTTYLWSLDDASTPRTLHHHPDAVLTLAFSPDGTWLATASADRSLTIAQAESGEHAIPTLNNVGLIRELRFHPNGRTLLSRTDEGVTRLWDVATGQPLGPPLNQARPIVAATFQPGGSVLATLDDQGVARLWDQTELTDNLEAIGSWVEVITGLHADEAGNIEPLTGAAWAARRAAVTPRVFPPRHSAQP